MKNILTKLLAIQQQNITVAKTAKNPFFKSKYITLDTIVATLAPILNEAWLLVYHYTENNCIVTVVADIESTETVISSFPMIESNDPQKLWSCITYAKRYNLGQLFNIITDRDDDWNAASVPVKDKQEENDFGKKNFTMTMFRSFVDNMKIGKRDKTLKETLEYIRSKYILSDDMEWNVTDYYNNLSSKSE